jgi:hypothetical protein
MQVFDVWYSGKPLFLRNLQEQQLGIDKAGFKSRPGRILPVRMTREEPLKMNSKW